MSPIALIANWNLHKYQLQPNYKEGLGKRKEEEGSQNDKDIEVNPSKSQHHGVNN